MAPRIINRGTRWVGGWVDPRAGLDAVGRRKYPKPSRGSNAGRPARSLVAILPELPILSNVNIMSIEVFRRDLKRQCGRNLVDRLFIVKSPINVNVKVPVCLTKFHMIKSCN
jgi:hypothetical protein